MCDGRSQGIGTICGAVLVLLLSMPVIVNGKEATSTTGKKSSETQKTNKTDTSFTFSGFINWAQRFGNRVGDNISEAASKTASAIKNGASDNQQQSTPQSEDVP